MEKRKPEQNWRLRQARERRSWTQKDVADQIDLPDVRTLRRWEAGEASPSPRYRARLCELFAMDAEELGLMLNVDPLLPTKEDQRRPESPQLSIEQRALSSASLKSQPVSSREQWNRHQLLKKVYSFWIKGGLRQSLRETTYLKLELCECAGVVAAPWTQVVLQPDQSIRPLPPDTHITRIYDDACGELLILGEPGAGKTTLLIELAHDLLERAVENEAHPIPVIFNLASWSLKQQPLTTWLVEELNSKYQVPQQVGLVWVADDHILPLLDGLDEVRPTLRKACIDAINAYRWQHGLVPLVLCSRKEEYLALGGQILLQQAICIQPLTRQYIEDYLATSDDQLAILKLILHEDAELQKLITTPLMLDILVQACRGKSIERFKCSGSLEMRRKQIFAVYVEYMFDRRKPRARYSVQQSTNWLAYLAREMKQHYQTEFYLERMQFDWLPTSRLQRLCQGLFIGLCTTLLSSVLVSFIAVPFVVDMFVTRFFPGLIIKADFLFFSTLALILTIALVIGIYKGGEACIKHILLRFMLWSGGQIPWNYPRFLDDAVACLLLRKVGGGYTFVHHLLLDYFALLNE